MWILWNETLDQDSLLVKRWNDNHSPGPVIRELVPSSHQRSELSNTILCIFSGWDQRIGEGIPIPDSLGEEATFINICIGNGSLKCHRVLIRLKAKCLFKMKPSDGCLFQAKRVCYTRSISYRREALTRLRQEKTQENLRQANVSSVKPFPYRERCSRRCDNRTDAKLRTQHISILCSSRMRFTCSVNKAKRFACSVNKALTFLRFYFLHQCDCRIARHVVLLCEGFTMTFRLTDTTRLEIS